jgi:DNA-binding NarL/FixJ family response regulator
MPESSISPADRVVTVRGELELMRRAGHLFAAKEEFICAANDLSTWSVSEAREGLLERLRARAASGISIRKLYNPGVLADPDDLAHLVEVTKIGVRIRICVAPLAHQTIVIDNRVAIIAGPKVDGVGTFSVVFTPEVIAGVRSLFLASWDTATDLDDFLRGDPPPLDGESMAILRLLSEGRKDEAAAREIGLSVRTYRRRVAELMVLLGADSRFQAGVRARELGLRV